MKVTHLSTSDLGGAGIAAKNLHLGLKKAGLHSDLVTKYRMGPAVENHYLLGTEKESVLNRLWKGITSRLPLIGVTSLEDYYLSGRPKGFEHFSLPWSGLKPGHNRYITDADIIHLHWVSDGFIDYRKIFELRNKKFVWTLHDMNPFTGGCHHSDGCLKFQANCNYCPQLKGTRDEYLSGKVLRYKREALSHIGDEQLTIVTPSNWLSQLSQSSSLFSRFRHKVIPNVVNHVPVVANRKVLRQKLGLKEDETVFLFVAHHYDNPRKGMAMLLAAFEKIKERSFRLLVLGEKLGNEKLSDKIIRAGYLNDREKISELYEAADAFLLPSRAENFPNTIVEALLSGTPVLASAVGGIAEQLNEKNGILLEPGNSGSWAEALLQFMTKKDKYDRDAIRKEALERYGEENIIQAYLQLYKELS
jgi:glycosyltransferase involved in cell wall biosynthesis